MVRVIALLMMLLVPAAQAQEPSEKAADEGLKPGAALTAAGSSSIGIGLGFYLYAGMHESEYGGDPRYDQDQVEETADSYRTIGMAMVAVGTVMLVSGLSQAQQDDSDEGAAFALAPTRDGRGGWLAMQRRF